MTDIWEPWTPRIGERVRVRISPECRDHARSMYPDYLEAVQGQTGTVIEWGARAWQAPLFERKFPGHRYPVQIDRPCADGRDKVVLAASELEPLD